MRREESLWHEALAFMRAGQYAVKKLIRVSAVGPFPGLPGKGINYPEGGPETHMSSEDPHHGNVKVAITIELHALVPERSLGEVFIGRARVTPPICSALCRARRGRVGVAPSGSPPLRAKIQR